MKKILCVLFTLLMLCACGSSNANTSVSDPNAVIIENSNTKLTKQDLYEMMKASASSDVLNSIFNSIAELYDIDLKEIEEEADDYIAMYQSMGYTSYIEYYYGSLEAYRASIINSAILETLGQEYIKDNFDKQVSNDKPVKMQMVTFDSQEKAEALIDAVNSGSTFDMAAIAQGVETAPIANVYLDSSELEIVIKEYLNSTENTGLSSIITTTSTSKNDEGEEVETLSYNVLNIVSRDVEDFKDEYIALAASTLEENTIRQYFLTKHNVTIHDQEIYDQISKNYEVAY